MIILIYASLVFLANGHQEIDKITSGEVSTILRFYGFYDVPRGKIHRTFSTDAFQGSEEALQRVSRSAEVQKVTHDSTEIGEDIRDHIKLEAGLVSNSICSFFY